MPTTLITPPAAEPVPLAEIKALLRVEGTSEDALLAGLIRAAREHVEAATGRHLVTQVWRLYLEAWPANRRVRVPFAPLRAVAACTVYDAGGTASAVPLARFAVDRTRGTALVVVDDAAAAPTRAVNGIELDLETGHGTPAEVPAPLVEAVKRLAALWYEHRLDRDAASLAATPPLVEALIAPWRVPLFGRGA
jgi:uncharacterized phiE125 gp8 family phage protein